MPRTWTHTEAFLHFGATPRNVQWSWSARSDDGTTVVVTLWQDRFHPEHGRLLYRWQPLPERARQSPGFSELMDNLTWARDHCGGRFKVIIAKAKEVSADPRSIERCFPSKMTMKLVEFDAVAGTFIAEAEGV